ncbi:MerR family transcriptional regulator [Segnochrobactraceae bacterium EtOH-i3]
MTDHRSAQESAFHRDADLREAGEGGLQMSFTIGDLAREFNLTHRTLRFYEDKGLIAPKRRGSTRLYSRRDRARLKLILMGKRVGFSLDEIREMVDLYDLRDGQVPQLRLAVAKFNERIAVLEAQKREIEQAVDDMKRTAALVAGMLREKERREAGEA